MHNKSQQKYSDLSPNDVPMTPVIHDIVERMRGLARLIPERGIHRTQGEYHVHQRGMS